MCQIIKSEKLLELTQLKRKFRNKILGYRSITKWKMITASVVYFIIFVFILSKLLGLGASKHAIETNVSSSNPSKKTFHSLTIESVKVSNGNILVNGTTDLPNGSNINVDFNLANTEKYYGSSNNAIVKSGHYSTTIKPRQITELEKGPYQITVDFFANSQNQSPVVLKLVGKKGENLKGPYAKKDQLGFTELETNKKVNLNLSITPPKPSSDGNYSWNHPVSSAYLKQFLTFMNDYYNGIESNVLSSDQTQWGIYVAGKNTKGWAMYQKVTYLTNLQEDPNILHARSDTAQAWVFLNSYEQDNDSKVFGDGSQASSLTDDEQQYKQFYNKAVKEAGNIK